MFIPSPSPSHSLGIPGLQGILLYGSSGQLYVYFVFKNNFVLVYIYLGVATQFCE